MSRPEKVRLGEILVQQKLLSEEQLTAALADQKRSGRKLGRVFVENGYVTEEQIAGALARQLNIPYLNLKFFNINPEVVRLLPETQARRFRALVLEDRRGSLLVGMSDPTDLFAYDEIAASSSRISSWRWSTRPKCWPPSTASTAAPRIFPTWRASWSRISAMCRSTSARWRRPIQSGRSARGQAAAVGVRRCGAGARFRHPHRTAGRRLQIRFRIDGVLHLQTEADIKIAPSLALRLKLMSDLDISEKRLPQDGRFAVRVKNQRIDVRISTMPTQYGESVVMRLLNQGGTSALDAPSACRAPCWNAPRHRAAPQRAGAGDRADRSGQDHHAVQRAVRTQLGREKADHGGRPGRIPPARH
jgi:MSHA biogenesis protein MshE